MCRTQFRLLLSAVAFLFVTTVLHAAAHAADDTFACLEVYTGPVIKRSGDQGGESFDGGLDFANETRLDFRTAVFHQWACAYKDGKGRPCPSKPAGTDGAFPVLLGGNWRVGIPPAKACLAGLTIRGEHPRDMDWWNAKNTSGALQVRAGEMILDGGRFDNMGEDALRVSGRERMEIRNSWITSPYDDCIENDGKSPGIVDDNLFDGCYVFYSAVGGGKDRPSGGVVEFTRNLIRLERKSSDTHRQFFKMWDDNSTHLELHNNIFMAGNYNPENWRDDKIISDRIQNDFLRECSGNIFLWYGQPGTLDHDKVRAGLPDGCITMILEGQQAEDFWREAKQNWINCHPKVPHISGDPSSNPAACEPNAYGGGEGGGGAETACHLLTSSDTVPPGFGAAYNPFSADRELLLTATCTETGATLIAGTGTNLQYVYEQGHVFKDGAWQPFTFSGAQKAGSWLVGRASATLSRSAVELSRNGFFVAYVCQWQGQQIGWKCGCRDSACSTPHWQLQVFRR